MIEVKEVLRQWLGGVGKKRIAARLALDPKTVRRYTRAGEVCGLAGGMGEVALPDEVLNEILATLCGAPARQHGEAWQRCQDQRAFIEEKLGARVRLSKVRRLMLREGVDVPYSTLHRFVVVEFGFGRKTVTVMTPAGARRLGPSASLPRLDLQQRRSRDRARERVEGRTEVN